MSQQILHHPHSSTAIAVAGQCVDLLEDFLELQLGEQFKSNTKPYPFTFPLEQGFNGS